MHRRVPNVVDGVLLMRYSNFLLPDVVVILLIGIRHQGDLALLQWLTHYVCPGGIELPVRVIYVVMSITSGAVQRYYLRLLLTASSHSADDLKSDTSQLCIGFSVIKLLTTLE